MGRRKVVKPLQKESLLTEELVLKALSFYSKPIRANQVVKQVLHIEKRLSPNSYPYCEAIELILARLVKAGRVQAKMLEDTHNPDNPGLFATMYYWLGPLERLAMA
jgi:hypothetical protein